MGKGWYARFFLVVTVVAGAWFALWPSLDQWSPAPAWVKRYFPGRISPGLDIKGGLRLTYEVEVDEAIRDRRDKLGEEMVERAGRQFGLIPKDDSPTREQMDKVRAKVRVKHIGERSFELMFSDAKDLSKLDRKFVSDYAELRESSRTATSLTLVMRDDRLENIRDTAVRQAVETISNRIDALAIRETSVTSRGTDVIIEIPGADEAMFTRMREIISRTARLDFKVVDDDNDLAGTINPLPAGIERQSEVVSAGENKPQSQSSFLVARGPGSRKVLSDFIQQLRDTGKIPEGHDMLLGRLDIEEDVAAKGPKAKGEGWRSYFLYGRSELTGDYIDDAFVAIDPQTRKPYVSMNFNPAGAEIFERLTSRNIKRRMAIVLDDRVESAPTIQARIAGGRAQITLGGYRDYMGIEREARDLVVVLRAGALPAPIRPANEQLIGPTLGRDAVAKGAQGALFGIVLVLLFMLFYYEVAGFVADIMVVLNVLMLFALLALTEATLTLPGIAGIALTVGMAVDANVLINERIREELRAGKTARNAVDQGFAHAFWSIFDSQLTTFFAAVVLFQYGTGPIKGFAVTLIFGIVTSLFSGVFCSRVMFEWLVRGLRIQRLRVG